MLCYCTIAQCLERNPEFIAWLDARIASGGGGSGTGVTEARVNQLIDARNFVVEAPQNGNDYVRCDGKWEIADGSAFQGTFATLAALLSDRPTGVQGQFAVVTNIGDGTPSTFYWNSVRGTWVNQDITASAYLALSPTEKECMPWIIIPG